MRLSLVCCLLVFRITKTSSQPITEATPENERQTRQLNFGRKCCPCPESSETAILENKDISNRDMDTIPDTAGSASELLPQVRGRVENCPPCFRDDSAAASSSHFSNQMRNVGSSVRPSVSKDDPTLLHPEVGLASSVLETLREATEEEYNEALARDAARSEVRSQEPDPIPEARKIVAILLNPDSEINDDVVASETHAQETRCINPLESTRSSSFGSEKLIMSPKPTFLKDLIGKKSSQNNLFHVDSGFAASEAQEVAEKKSANVDFTASPIYPAIKLPTENKDSFIRRNLDNMKSVMRLSTPDKVLDEITQNKFVPPLSKNSYSQKEIPKLTLDSTLQHINDRINTLNDLIIRPRIPIIKLNKDNNRRTDTLNSKDDNNDIQSDDCPSSSNIREVVYEHNKEELSKRSEFKKLSDHKPNKINSFGKSIIPNILNLKDVELLPQDNRDIVIKNQNVPIIQSLNKLLDLTKSKQLPELRNILKPANNVLPTQVKVNNINRPCQTPPPKDENSNNNMKTEIIEVIPSPSENIESVASKETNPCYIQNQASSPATKSQVNNVPITSDKKIVNNLKNNEEEESVVSSIENKPVDILNSDEERIITEQRCNDDIIDSENSPTDNIPLNLVPNDHQSDQASPLSFNIDSDNPLKSLRKKPAIALIDKLKNMKTNPRSKLIYNKNSEGKTAIMLQTQRNEGSEVSMQDLQKMSDSLLDSSNKARLNNIKAKSNDECLEQDKNISEEPDKTENKDVNSDLDSDSDLSPSNNICTFTPSSQSVEKNKNKGELSNLPFAKEESTEQNDVSDTKCPDNTILDIPSEKSDVTAENSCPSDFIGNDASSKEVDVTSSSEMSAQARDPVTSTSNQSFHTKNRNLLGSPLNPNLIIQPQSLLNGEGLFDTPLIPLTVNTNIPTLDELRGRLANIFSNSNLFQRTSEKDSGVFDDPRRNESTKDNEDFENEASMLTGASNSDLQTTVPSPERMKEVNLNIFQLSPLKLAKNLPEKLQYLNPGLNLNSFKAKLQLPDIDLSPLKFQSTLGRKNDLLGATLSLEPAGTFKSKTKNDRLLTTSKMSGADSVFQSLTTPVLEDMKAALSNQREKILKSPQINLAAASARATESIKHLNELKDSLHSNTANALSSLQRSLSSTLDEAIVKSDSLLGNPIYAKPEKEDIFETLARAKLDMDDKFKFIHSSLAERLSSVQGKFKDSSKIPSLSLALPDNKKVKPRVKSQLKYNKTPHLDVSRKSLGSLGSKGKLISLKGNSLKEEKILRNKNSLSRSETQSNNIKTSETLRSGLSPLERGINYKKLSVSPVQPTPEIKRPALNRLLNPSAEGHTFSPKSIVQSKNVPSISSFISSTVRPTMGTQNSKLQSSSTHIGKNKDLRSSQQQKLRNRLNLDSSGSPSQQVINRTLPNSNIWNTDPKAASERIALKLRRPLLRPVVKVNIAKMKLPERVGSFKSRKVARTDDMIPKSQESLVKDQFKTINYDVRPVVPVNPSQSMLQGSALSTIKDTFKKKNMNLGKGSTNPKDILGLPGPKSDMIEDASQTLQTVVTAEEPLKENVRYRCRMICTRE